MSWNLQGLEKMTEIQFVFRGLTLRQCEILSSLNQALGIENDYLTKEAHINLIHSRFNGPRQDKHWNGIKIEYIQLFSDLKKELSEEQWLQAPTVILEFILNYGEFRRIKDDYDRVVKEKEMLVRIEREKKLQQVRSERIEAEAKARLNSVKVLSEQLAEETAKKRKAPSIEDYCKGCGQLLPPYYECYC